MKATVIVRPRAGVLDPQGEAVAKALGHLGFDEVQGVRQGKIIELELDGNDLEKARTRLEQMCHSLLANSVIEDYQVSLEP